MEISDFMKKSLDYFDVQNNKYETFLSGKYIMNNKQFIEKDTNNIININYEILGIFQHETNVFIWGWLIPYYSIDEIKITRELLDYGLRLDPKSNTLDHFYLKTLLVNSRINIKNDIELDLILAISSYLLKDKIKFIFKSTLLQNNNNNNYSITTFYLIKNI